MNRTFSYSQEIFCSCFDSEPAEVSLGYYKSKQRKPFITARQNKMSASNSLHQLLTKKCSPKKSLKRQYQNNSLKINQIKDTKPKLKITHLQPIKIQGISTIQNNQNHNIESIDDFSLSKYEIPQTPIKQLDINSRRNNIKDRKSTFFKKAFPYIQDAQDFQEEQIQYQTIFTKSKQFPKKCEPTQDQSQPRTIKKTHIRKPSNYILPFGMKQNENHKIFQLRKKISQQQLSPGRKRISLKIQNPSQFDKIFQFRQIQSFQSSITDQSQVVEVGRFTWAPNGQRKQQGVKFISSLHIRDTSRTSKLSSNRPSKMMHVPGHI